MGTPPPTHQPAEGRDHGRACKQTCPPCSTGKKQWLKGLLSVREGNLLTNPTASANGRGTVGTLVSEALESTICCTPLHLGLVGRSMIQVR